MREGWELKKLEKVCERIFAGGDVPKNNLSKFKTDKYTIPIFANGEKNKGLYGYTDIAKVVEPSITVSARGTIGYSEIRNEPFFPVVRLIVLMPDKDIVDLNFLKYVVSGMEFKKSGTSIPQLTVPMIKKYQANIPPLPEQMQIVNTLDKAFKQIDQAKANLEKNLHNAKELLESYLQKIFLNNISGNEFVSLNTICELIVDCEHKTAPTQEEGYPSIRTPNIGFGILLLDKVNKVSEETYKEWTRRAIPKEDDLILAREAPAGNIGIIPKGIQVCLGQRTVLIRPKKDIVLSKYLVYLILSKDVQESLLSHSKGATVGHINMKDIRAFKIYNLPSISVQEVMINNINRIYVESKNLQTHYQQKLNNLEELKKSILQKAFRGEL